MVNISKFGDSAIKFTFTDNYRYLHNGEIEVPLNSLILVVDESDMVTFKKIDGDPFVSFLISDSNFESKETLIYFYKTSMVGSTSGGSESGITSGDVQTMIDTSLEDYYDIDEIDAALSGKADTSAVTEAITAAVSGKADTSSVYTKSEVDTALSAKQDISGITAYTTSSDVETYVSGYTYDKATIDSKVASGGTFDPTNYYDKTATDALLDNKFDASAFTSYSAATDARISEDEEVTAAALNALNDGKQDTLIAGSGITISGNVISAEGGNLVVELTQAEYDELVSGGTVDPNAFYIITDAQEINISDYYTSAQTQSAINAAVSGKQDTLIAGSGITISGNVISANGGSSITVDTALDSGSTNPVENRVIYDKFDEVEEVTAAALNALNEELSGKADSSDVTAALSGKQDTLIAGTNIKTINNESILGSGNIDIQGGGSSYTGVSGITINENNEIYYKNFVKTWLTSNHDDNYAVYWLQGANSKIWINGNKPEGRMNWLRSQFSFGLNQLNMSIGGFALGENNSINGQHSGGLCNGNTVNGNYSLGVNYQNKTNNSSEFASGQYNNSVSASTTFGNSGNTLFSVGNGTSDSARHNAFEIRQNGDIYVNDGTNDVKLQDTITATAANTTALGGLKLVKLTQSEYDALATKDDNTLYVIVN